ncbi:ThiF family adenylyltransferase [Ectobacillus antri]|uniref:ThiF family adenylyltransferase n=1 Tax=Ectobacillus antri TaxID=2486280 RepID=A0ABT6H7B9_9BACI|nr:ThiF family adenylyltransferase [Ectobacillus antri]MDG4658169.1 ThiF family adenylyltransferase [Ectobacillus antri]MDG5755237.1 ThiF family adenylyltransferase [Ectobacillus antri]
MNDRYARQVSFQSIGKNGQKKLADKHVLIIGAGALGSMGAEMLARAGVGCLTIVDRDYVDWSNLQRQLLYDEEDVKRHIPKAIAAKNRLEKINGDIRIKAYVEDVTPSVLERLLYKVDVILDATDNFETRFIINDAAQKHRIPWVYGACIGSQGITYTFLPRETPCLTCLLETVPLGMGTCDTIGVISPAVAMTVSYQVAEVLKLLTDNEVRRTIVSFDVWKNEYSAIDVSKLRNENCPSCGAKAHYPYLHKTLSQTVVLCGRDSVQIRLQQELPLEEYKQLLEHRVDGLVINDYLLSFMAERKKCTAFRDGRVFIHGTKNIAEAKSMYHRYFS